MAPSARAEALRELEAQRLAKRNRLATLFQPPHDLQSVGDFEQVGRIPNGRRKKIKIFS